MRLENKLLTYILLPLITLLLISNLILHLYYSVFQKRHAEGMLHSEAEALKERIENTIKGTSSDLALLLSNEAVVNYFIYSEHGLLDHAEDMRWLIEKNFLMIGKEKPEYFGIRLIRIDGKSVIDIMDRRISYEHYDFSDMNWFKETLSLTNGDINISKPCLCKELGKPTITVSRLYIDDMGRKKGVVSIDIHIPDLFEKLVSKQVGNGYAYLVDKDGLIMAHTDSAMVGSVLKDDKMRNDTGMKKVYIPLEIRGLSLVLVRPMEELISFGRGLRLFNLIFSITMISIVLLTVTITVRGLRKPIRQITTVMDEIRKGSLDIKMELNARGEDELAILSRTFNSMALAIKEREVSLRKSEERYRTLFEMANDAIYLIDPETYKIVDCNKKAGDLLGYSLDELKQMTFRDIHTPNESDLILHKLSEVIGSGLSTTIPEHYHMRKDGSKIAVEASISIIEVGGKRLMISIVRDITERKKKDEEIKKRVKELEEFYEIAVNREIKMRELKEKLEKKEEELKILRERYKG